MTSTKRTGPPANEHTVSRRHTLGLLAGGTVLATLGGSGAATIGESADQSQDGPVTAVFGLVRADEMSHEEFVDYFHTTHIPLAQEVIADQEVELLAYRSVIPVTPADSPYDGIGELTFPDLGTFQSLTETDAWQEQVLGDVPEFTNPDQNVVIVGTAYDHLSDTTTTERPETTTE